MLLRKPLAMLTIVKLSWKNLLWTNS